jgi:hypothetical protein
VTAAGERQFLAADDDPEEALTVILGGARGDREYALICLGQAIGRGQYPRGWEPRR